MITPAELGNLIWRRVPVAELREKLSGGLQQEKERDRKSIQAEVRLAMSYHVDAVQVVLDAVCDDVLVPSDPHGHSVLYYALMEGNSENVMRVVEHMRKRRLRVTRAAPFMAVYARFFKEDVEHAVVSVMDPSVFGTITSVDDALRVAIRCASERRARAIEFVLKHGPTMEERLEAGMERFRYVHIAAKRSDLKTLQQMHDLLPMLPDESSRRGELVDYARAIDLAAGNFAGSRDEVPLLLEYLAEQAGDEEVFDLCPFNMLLTRKADLGIEWLVERAPQLVETACKQTDCLSLLIGTSRKTEYLVEQMVELVDPELLCDLMRQSPPAAKQRKKLHSDKGWRRMLRPIHEAVPESMDGLKLPWLVEAIEDRAYGDVEYMLGLCTREHLVMRNEKGDTAYDMAARDKKFPRDLLEGLKVVAKGAHS